MEDRSGPRIARPRAYAEICAECHLGPVDDPAFDQQYPDKSFWSRQAMGAPRARCSIRSRRASPAWARTARRPTCWRRAAFRFPASWIWSRRATSARCGAARSADAFLDRHAVLDRVDDRGRPHQPEMDGRSRRLQEPIATALWGSRKNCPNPMPCEAENGDSAPNLLSRAPAERRLGDRAVPSQRLGAVAVLDAQAGGRASQAILPGRARLRSAAGRLRVVAGEAQRCKKGETLFSMLWPRTERRSTATACSVIRWRERRARANRASSAAC